MARRTCRATARGDDRGGEGDDRWNFPSPITAPAFPPRTGAGAGAVRPAGSLALAAGLRPWPVARRRRGAAAWRRIAPRGQCARPARRAGSAAPHGGYHKNMRAVISEVAPPPAQAGQAASRPRRVAEFLARRPRGASALQALPDWPPLEPIPRRPCRPVAVSVGPGGGSRAAAAYSANPSGAGAGRGLGAARRLPRRRLRRRRS